MEYAPFFYQDDVITTLHNFKELPFKADNIALNIFLLFLVGTTSHSYIKCPLYILCNW